MNSGLAEYVDKVDAGTDLCSKRNGNLKSRGSRLHIAKFLVEGGAVGRADIKAQGGISGYPTSSDEARQQS